MSEKLEVNENYSEIIYEGNKIRIYNSFKGERLPEETFDEYRARRKAIKNYELSKKKGAMKHVSSSLIPQMQLNYNTETNKFEETVATDDKGKVIFSGKTKGVTYYKNNKEQEHLSLVEHFKKIANNEQGV